MEPSKPNATVTFELMSGDELARLAFDQKIEDSGLRVLRHRLYPLIAVVSAMLSLFGVGLTWWVHTVASRAAALNADIDVAKTTLSRMNGDIAAVRQTARDLELKRNELTAEMNALRTRSGTVETEALTAIRSAAAADATGIAARDLAFRAQTELSLALRDIDQKKQGFEDAIARVKNNADASKADRDAIQNIRGTAEEFAKSVEAHRGLVAATIADAVTLKSNDTAAVTVPDLNTAGTFKIEFETGSIQRRKEFEVAYRINDGKAHIVKVSRNDIRRAIDLEDTNGQYRFMIDFIYSGVIVRDFITFRVSAVPPAINGVQRRASLH